MSAPAKVSFKRSALISFFLELGFATAQTWKGEGLTKKVKSVQTLLDEQTQPTTPEGKKTLALIEAAIKDKAEIEIEDDEPAAPKSSKKKATAAADKKGSKKKKATAAADKKLDKWGDVVGSIKAKINACITRKPKSMAELSKEAGVRGRYARLAQLVKEKKIVHEEKGWRLA